MHGHILNKTARNNKPSLPAEGGTGHKSAVTVNTRRRRRKNKKEKIFFFGF